MTELAPLGGAMHKYVSQSHFLMVYYLHFHKRRIVLNLNIAIKSRYGNSST